MGIGGQEGWLIIVAHTDTAGARSRIRIAHIGKAHSANWMWRKEKMAELKPCPFCGGKVSVVLCDDEGNLHDEAYREHPYSGLGFMLHHAHEDNPECPIASYECDGGILGGVYIYDTEEQAVEAWNRSVNDG